MAEGAGGEEERRRVERVLAPNDVLAIDMCGPFTPSLGGNLYMFYGVDHATGYIVNNGTASVASPRRWRCLSAVWWTWRTRRERR